MLTYLIIELQPFPLSSSLLHLGARFEAAVLNYIGTPDKMSHGIEPSRSLSNGLVGRRENPNVPKTLVVRTRLRSFME